MELFVKPTHSGVLFLITNLPHTSESTKRTITHMQMKRAVAVANNEKQVEESTR